MSKLTFIQIETAFHRAVYGESVRSIAHSLGVTEGALRHHFRKGTSPRQLQGLAWALIHAEQARDRLDEGAQQAVDRIVVERLAGIRK